MGKADLFSFLSCFVLADGIELFHNEFLPGDLNLWTCVPDQPQRYKVCKSFGPSEHSFPHWTKKQLFILSGCEIERTDVKAYKL